jgi:multiple antibiotic resistance protein
MDSIGNVPLFISLLKDFSAREQKKIIRRELVIALIVITVFYFIGDFLMKLIDIQKETISIAGGIILFMISIKMVFSSSASHKATKSSPAEVPFIVPLAIPLTAGPAVLATVIVYSQQAIHIVALSSIAIAWAASAAVLMSAGAFKKILGEKGLLACEKLMGLLLTLMAVQMCLKGITMYIRDMKILIP